MSAENDNEPADYSDSEPYVVEYCFRQQCFHIQPLRTALQTNLRAVLDGCAMSYVPLGLFRNSEAAGRWLDNYLRPKLAQNGARLLNSNDWLG